VSPLTASVHRLLEDAVKSGAIRQQLMTQGHYDIIIIIIIIIIKVFVVRLLHYERRCIP